MNRGAVLAVVAFALVAGGVLFVGGPLSGGVPDFPADDGATTTAEATTSETTQSDSAGGSVGDEPTPRTTTTAGYDFTIETIEKCGNTCRDVTARLTNTGGGTRRNVRVTTKMYADETLLWSGNETIGTLEPSESHVSTKRVNVGFSGGMAISANDGYVTIVTIIDSADGTTRFSDRRKVA